MTFEKARQVADAILFEGYVLYPYRASAVKNRLRWQFGVIAPPGVATGEPAFARTECLIEAGTAPVLDLRLRFMHVRSRVPTARVGDGADAGPPDWDEGVLQEVDAGVALEGDSGTREIPFAVAGDAEIHEGATVRSAELDGLITVAWERSAEPRGLVKATIRVENHTRGNDPAASREEMLRLSMASAHTLLRVGCGAFVSLLEPPEWAAAAVASCRNRHTWPVLIGEPGSRDLMLSSPIILYDYPRVAAESPADLCDATEIDEILTLRTMALTDAEKAEARATDPRAAHIINGADTMPPEVLDRLHGALRYLDEATGRTAPVPAEPPDAPWWDPGQDAAVCPDTDTVAVSGGTAAKGSRVRLCPGQRRADAQDMFLRDRIATVAGVFFDVDGERYLAVTLDDDLGVDLHQWHGRYLYFTPEEVELHRDGS
ncbi:hypothetical protein [Allosalinactinospora lopnorensis]|uniref:hypothetical protein n=1 Tax=Allosalinactinospora lopnorensis TaxID=1352348 RepID=UPI000623CF7C|nr:hypothetical protein [Allosalinactinospora lopnorensis]